jgi:hypothetical protein
MPSNKRTMDESAIRSRIETALAHAGFAGTDEVTRRDIAFHMTDWLADLEQLIAIYESPERATDEQVHEALSAFLIHAPAHLAAAAKLFTGDAVTDVFRIGAVEK